MAKDKEDLRKFIAVDMANGFTYIGRVDRGKFNDLPMMLEESLAVKTENIVSSIQNYIQAANQTYTNYKKENLEKEIRIDHPGPIHYLE